MYKEDLAQFKMIVEEVALNLSAIAPSWPTLGKDAVCLKFDGGHSDYALERFFF